MKKILAILTTALALTTVSSARAADRPNIVNGMPCFKEVCVGEDLKNLGQIKWQSMSGEVARLKGWQIQPNEMLGDRATLKALSPYWTTNKLDPKAFALIKKIKGFCQSNFQPLEAMYLDPKGRETHVYFNLIADNGGKTQRFVVSNIDKIVPNHADLTMEQREQIKNDVSLKYPGLLDNRSMFNTTPYVEVRAVRNVMISLWAPSVADKQNKELFLKYPGCGGDRKIQID